MNPKQLQRQSRVVWFENPCNRFRFAARRDFVVNRLRQISDVSTVMPKRALCAYPNISLAYKSGS